MRLKLSNHHLIEVRDIEYHKDKGLLVVKGGAKAIMFKCEPEDAQYIITALYRKGAFDLSKRLTDTDAHDEKRGRKRRKPDEDEDGYYDDEVNAPEDDEDGEEFRDEYMDDFTFDFDDFDE